MMHQMKFRASIWLILKRLIQFFGLVGFWYLARLWDIVWRRDSLERRARRARALIEWIGGTTVKLGQ